MSDHGSDRFVAVLATDTSYLPRNPDINKPPRRVLATGPRSAIPNGPISQSSLWLAPENASPMTAAAAPTQPVFLCDICFLPDSLFAFDELRATVNKLPVAANAIIQKRFGRI